MVLEKCDFPLFTVPSEISSHSSALQYVGICTM